MQISNATRIKILSLQLATAAVMMQHDSILTAEQFLDSRWELPESGQWAELEAGQVSLFQPPDVDHGNVVLNLSKVLAAYVQQKQRGYPCFDLGMQLETEPDTVRFPAGCYFLHGKRFTETDAAISTSVPELVFELASTADRRECASRRVEDYLAWGVEEVWVIDTKEECVHLIPNSGNTQQVANGEVLASPQLLPDFSCRSDQLFREPNWWKA